MTKLIISVFDGAENIVGKEEIASTSNFFFSHNVCKRLLFQTYWKVSLCGNGLINVLFTAFKDNSCHSHVYIFIDKSYQLVEIQCYMSRIGNVRQSQKQTMWLFLFPSTLLSHDLNFLQTRERNFLKTLWEKEIFCFPHPCLPFPNQNFNFWFMFILSANAFNVDQSKILLICKGLNPRRQ